VIPFSGDAAGRCNGDGAGRRPPYAPGRIQVDAPAEVAPRRAR